MSLNSNALASLRLFEAAAAERALRDLDQKAAEVVASKRSSIDIRLRRLAAVPETPSHPSKYKVGAV